MFGRLALHRERPVLLGLGCLLVLTMTFYRTPLWAQQAVTSATLSGTVEDVSGARVVKALVTAQNMDRNQTFTIATNGEGRFQFLSLPVGAYELKVAAEGFPW